MTKPRLRIIKGQGKRPKGKHHGYDPHGGATKTPQEACEQAYRRGANQIAHLIAELCRRNPGREREIVEAVAARSGVLRTGAFTAWRGAYMHQMDALVVAALRLETPWAAPKPKVNVVRVLQPGGTQKTSVRVGEEE